MVENSKNLLIKLIFLISIIALVSAFFIEYVLGHQPCNLCILREFLILAIIIILLNFKFIHLKNFLFFCFQLYFWLELLYHYIT